MTPITVRLTGALQSQEPQGVPWRTAAYDMKLSGLKWGRGGLAPSTHTRPQLAPLRHVTFKLAGMLGRGHLARLICALP